VFSIASRYSPCAVCKTHGLKRDKKEAVGGTTEQVAEKASKADFPQAEAC
jgi:hypothetical protein